MGLATGSGVALVGDGTGVALLGIGTGPGEEQGRPDLPGALGTGVGTAGTGQATPVGSADADGIGLAGSEATDVARSLRALAAAFVD